MRQFIRSITFLLFLFSCSTLISIVFATTNELPNVIVIYADDLGWQDTSLYNGQQYHTPNIKKLASRGVTFTNAYSNAGNCAPSRASLLTGLYTPRHGIYTVGKSARGPSEKRKLTPPQNITTLNPKFLTIADVFSKKGYHTSAIGKWHLGSIPLSEYGFKESVATSELGHPPSYFYPYKKGKRQLKDISNKGKEAEYLTDRLTDEAISFVTRNKATPFFLYLPYYAVHTPIEAPKSEVNSFLNAEALGKIKSAKYAAMISILDKNIGRLMESLDNLSLSKNTMVVFLSDNGAYDPVTHSQPLRDYKGTLYEGGIRIPMVISWPKKINANTKINEPVLGSDLFATFSQLIGIDEFKSDGVSLLNLITKEEPLLERAIFWHAPVYIQQFKPYINNKNYPFWRTTPVAAIRRGKYKLIEFYESNIVELYDLTQDISERKNLSDGKPQLSNALLKELHQWQEYTGAAMAIKGN